MAKPIEKWLLFTYADGEVHAFVAAVRNEATSGEGTLEISGARTQEDWCRRSIKPRCGGGEASQVNLPPPETRLTRRRLANRYWSSDPNLDDVVLEYRVCCRSCVDSTISNDNPEANQMN